MNTDELKELMTTLDDAWNSQDWSAQPRPLEPASPNLGS